MAYIGEGSMVPLGSVSPWKCGTVAGQERGLRIRDEGKGWKTGSTYSVTGLKLLFCPNNVSAPLGGVEGSAAADDGLALGAACATGFAADFGDGVPVFGHLGGYGWMERRGRFRDEMG